MTEVTIQIDSANKEATVASLASALETVFGLAPEKTRPGLEMGFDAHQRALEVLMDHTHPDQVGFPASVAAMFAWSQLSDSHLRTSKQSLDGCLAAAAMHEKIGRMIGED